MWRTTKQTVKTPRFGPKEDTTPKEETKTPEPSPPVHIEKPTFTKPLLKKTPPEPEHKTPKKQIVPEFIGIEKMSVRYIQPIPVPNFIEFLQHLKHKDVDFVKIPISKKEDALYLRKPISKLLGHLTGVHWDKISDLIKRYNAENTDHQKCEDVRDALFNLMELAAFFADENDIEFIREPID